MVLSASELADLQAEAARFLPDVCVVQTQVQTREADGSISETYSAGVSVACRISPSGYQAGEQVVGGQLAGLASWTITLPAGTAVAKSSRITSGGRTFEVLGVGGPRSWELTRRVSAEERTA